MLTMSSGDRRTPGDLLRHPGGGGGPALPTRGLPLLVPTRSAAVAVPATRPGPRHRRHRPRRRAPPRSGPGARAGASGPPPSVRGAAPSARRPIAADSRRRWHGRRGPRPRRPVGAGLRAGSFGPGPGCGCGVGPSGTLAQPPPARPSGPRPRRGTSALCGPSSAPASSRWRARPSSARGADPTRVGARTPWPRRWLRLRTAGPPEPGAPRGTGRSRPSAPHGVRRGPGAIARSGSDSRCRPRARATSHHAQPGEAVARRPQSSTDSSSGRAWGRTSAAVKASPSTSAARERRSIFRR